MQIFHGYIIVRHLVSYIYSLSMTCISFSYLHFSGECLIQMFSSLLLSTSITQQTSEIILHNPFAILHLLCLCGVLKVCTPRPQRFYLSHLSKYLESKQASPRLTAVFKLDLSTLLKTGTTTTTTEEFRNTLLHHCYRETALEVDERRACLCT